MHDTCMEKGINLICTGDFVHPEWLGELKGSLEPAQPGLFRMKGSQSAVRFVLGGEIATVFDVGGKSKRIHQVILMPSFESVDALAEILSKKGDLRSDGRPQVSMTSAELVEEALRVEKRAFVFPAHLWTPFFGALGAKSGFNSMKEAYGDQAKNIYAIEMGLSSNPPMNWRLSALGKYALLGNSDMHSLLKMGREMNIFEIDEKALSYDSLIKTIKDKDRGSFKMVLKFFPEEGKYHFDGHRQCVVSVDPTKYDIRNCPICGKKLTIGVMHRVMDLADKPEGYVPENAIPYFSSVPLREVIAYVLKKGEASVAVEQMYRKMIDAVGTEFDILVDAPIEKIAENSTPEIGTAISNIRERRINVVPGYDGVFGKIDLLNRESKANMASGWKQKGLRQFEETS
jgi:uncharacterized protein (TIGR00375 family)